MLIEEGKFYKTRDGRKVGPMKNHWGGWMVGEAEHWTWLGTEGGNYVGGRVSYVEPHKFDLVEEWKDTHEMDYNDGNWHPWTGGGCPVHPKSFVEAMTRNGYTISHEAFDLDWGVENGPDYIVAFKVVAPFVEKKEPREFWLCCMGDLCGYTVLSTEPIGNWDEVIHVKEVIHD